MYEEMVAHLATEDADEWMHALEEQIGERGLELMRQLYQDHLDLRAAREQRVERVEDAGQVVHTRVGRDHQRRLATVSRTAYRASSELNLYPADSVLYLPDQPYSHGLRKLGASNRVDTRLTRGHCASRPTCYRGEGR